MKRFSFVIFCIELGYKKDNYILEEKYSGPKMRWKLSDIDTLSIWL